MAVSPFVRLLVHNGDYYATTAALLDPGCETSLISKDLADILNLNGKRTNMKLATFHGRDPKLTVIKTRCQISPTTNSNRKIDVEPLLVVPDLRVNRRCIKWSQHQHQWAHLQYLDLKDFDWREVGIFIGANVPDALKQLETRAPIRSGPHGVKTPFGWTVQGNVPKEICESTTATCNSIQEEENDDVLQQFWTHEWCGSMEDRKRITTMQDEAALAKLDSTIKLIGTEAQPRYEIGLHFVTPQVVLPNNRSSALQRLYAVESRFRVDPLYANRYTKAIEAYMDLGFARRLRMDELPAVGPPGKVWYVPHGLVGNILKPDKPRLVFDADSRFKNVCLNDALHNGPLLMTDMLTSYFISEKTRTQSAWTSTKCFYKCASGRKTNQFSDSSGDDLVILGHQSHSR